ncbi:MAG TPA: hypothetical protein VK190_02700 [Pseudoneobacillus sp.]|nr:hypothetical protein [Pseudoneobacillus sp.]
MGDYELFPADKTARLLKIRDVYEAYTIYAKVKLGNCYLFYCVKNRRKERGGFVPIEEVVASKLKDLDKCLIIKPEEYPGDISNEINNALKVYFDPSLLSYADDLEGAGI